MLSVFDSCTNLNASGSETIARVCTLNLIDIFGFAVLLSKNSADAFVCDSGILQTDIESIRVPLSEMGSSGLVPLPLRFQLDTFLSRSAPAPLQSKSFRLRLRSDSGSGSGSGSEVSSAPATMKNFSFLLMIRVDTFFVQFFQVFILTQITQHISKHQ